MKAEAKTRMTNQRRIILDLVRSLNTHATADEIHRLVRERMPRVSLGTVYRNLELLSNQGLVRKLEHTGAQRRYDGNLDFHYHLRCVLCGRVVDAPLEPMPQFIDLVRSRTDFDVLGYELEFHGLCPECRSTTQPMIKKGIKEDTDA